ncbi:MAG: DNA starvation/stationary phase protection protein Dps [Dehalococcoidia bacterium]
MPAKSSARPKSSRNGAAAKAKAATSRRLSPVVDTLNGRLADMIDLHWQIKQAHWNVTGANFIATHELFDEQAVLARTAADTIAERIRALKSTAEGTIRLAVERTTIDEFPHGEIDWREAVGSLVERYEQLSAQMKDASDEAADAEDKGTEDLYVGLIREIDKAAYFLRSHLG